MDTKMIESLIKQLEQSSLNELELTLGEDSLHLVKAGPVAPAPVAPASNPVPATPVNPTPAAQPEQPAGTAIKAPLVGIVYLAPKPGADPYVKVGDHVKKGEVVCIIESMKMMNEIKSTVSGTLKAVEVDNESLVEYDQPLFTVEE
ncbi:acetyl-CoA carboxylase biotin carboxyl carrier protein [Lacticaseibacillus casei]|jgi:acetyl-CoA carboxylase biotin carboxyl carrier protein|uniref:Biotin carboxyl carrier protein of acetyl-CoA carboxylase n=1 Tax=Lacticaseibacillus huelsenbergensis TaxID=3035291 RepID=A0ABY8DU69_9LACO|nr:MULTISPECIES: acetyl-CoA carboxylase biotin carboxyl carrier protein [Lacticaseibacillus]MDG3060964.1 acetyl-CoA carboxylase biotin carboxyl carrier protein [Lacticaseibacillus sp. BCRC 81376]QVI37259.1 acetyl-CoA carboxylase biotin carboxyl carrier protein [Lacticaseibacillus casei]QXG59051.1 acetyl-CoA carboxylase biotin carboxyl carrier protein [Lacticaseibacillus casei]WFB39502.1 acetyl-CoA carboxylase biotin carboxyl carrier protein [Lacticaseibacillus huelsenbergensis]WFB41204.1 acety